MKTLSPLLAAAAMLGLAACSPEPLRSASSAGGTPQNAQQGFGTSQEDRFVTERGGSSAAVQNAVATGRDSSGMVRQGTGRGTLGTRQTVRARADGGGQQSVDRGENVGPPRQ